MLLKSFDNDKGRSAWEGRSIPCNARGRKVVTGKAVAGCEKLKWGAVRRGKEW